MSRLCQASTPVVVAPTYIRMPNSIDTILRTPVGYNPSEGAQARAVFASNDMRPSSLELYDSSNVNLLRQPLAREGISWMRFCQGNRWLPMSLGCVWCGVDHAKTAFERRKISLDYMEGHRFNSVTISVTEGMDSLQVIEVNLEFTGGEGGIRTPGRGLGPYDGLANRCFRPLSHLSSRCGPPFKEMVPQRPGKPPIHLAPAALSFRNIRNRDAPSAISASEIHCDVSSGPPHRLPCSWKRKNSTTKRTVP